MDGFITPVSGLVDTSATCRGSVLIADPEFERMSNLGERLVCEGYHLSHARTVRQATISMLEHRFDFALLELRYGDGDAFDILHRLPTYKQAPRVVIHSRYCNVPLAVRAINAGASDVLPKPGNLDLILSVLFGRPFAPHDEFLKPDRVYFEHIKAVYVACNRNVSRTARQLAMHRKSLTRYMEKHSLTG